MKVCRPCADDRSVLRGGHGSSDITKNPNGMFEIQRLPQWGQRHKYRRS